MVVWAARSAGEAAEDGAVDQIERREGSRARRRVARLSRGLIWEGGPRLRLISPESVARERGRRRRGRARGGMGLLGRDLGCRRKLVRGEEGSGCSPFIVGRGCCAGRRRAEEDAGTGAGG